MGLKIKFGKKTKQGYYRVLSSANMTDCYSYGFSALVAVEFLKINKSRATGMHMGFCISALRQVLFAKIKRDPNRSDRTPLGTLFWGRNTHIDKKLLKDPNFNIAVDDIKELISIWGKNICIDD